MLLVQEPGITFHGLTGAMFTVYGLRHNRMYLTHFI
jgi:hypothetical protein